MKYAWRRRRTSQRSKPGGGRLNNEALLAHVRAIHADIKGEYGWPRVWKELLARGPFVGKDRMQRLTRLRDIKARGKRKFVVTTDSRHDLPVAPNLLARDFHPRAPDRVWSSGITYIATDQDWLYLPAVIDLFSYGMRSSVSRKGNCWQNAPTGGLSGSLKVGRLFVRNATPCHAMDEVIDWLTLYDHRRLHSTLGYGSPMRFEAKRRARKSKKAAYPCSTGASISERSSCGSHEPHAERRLAHFRR